MLTIGSLCTGLGGLDLAVAQHFDARLIWASDDNAQVAEFLEARLPHVPNLGDLRLVDSSSLDVPDIVTTGWPCQSVSRAGRIRGTADDRWLFDSIIEFIERLPQRPPLLVVENVPNLLSHDQGRTALGVVREVARLGYDLRWGVVRASDAGLPHRRARFFALATHAERLGPGRRGPRQVPGPTSQGEGQGEGRKRVRSHARHGGPTPGGSWDEFQPAIDRWEQLIGRPHPPALVDDRLSPAWVEWAMGFDKGYLTEVITHRRHALRILGNAVAPHQGLLALRLLTQ